MSRDITSQPNETGLTKTGVFVDFITINPTQLD